MTNEPSELPSENVEEGVDFAYFLESVPPSNRAEVFDLAASQYPQDGFGEVSLRTPDVMLYCYHESCGGKRVFRRREYRGLGLPGNEWRNLFVTYVCSNCRSSEKIYSLAVKLGTDGHSGLCMKFGEAPVFGPHTPPRLLKLIGPDRDLYLMGRRCESQGQGIGAFAYYRRVVENQKERILDEVIKVAKREAKYAQLVPLLESARAETRFSVAVKAVKDAVPDSLFIAEHNPLTLLHSALSKGLHELDDTRCLDVARSVRVVLEELSERLARALKDDAEIKGAVGRLMVKNARRTPPSSSKGKGDRSRDDR